MRFQGRGGDGSYEFTDVFSLRCGRRTSVGGDADQVIRNDTKPDPAMHSVETAIAAPNESMASFQDTNAAFRPDTPSLATTEPRLAFVGSPLSRFRTTPGQHDAADAAFARRLLVLRGAEAPISRRQIRRPPKDGAMAIERGRPQGDVRRPLGVDVIGRDDLVSVS